MKAVRKENLVTGGRAGKLGSEVQAEGVFSNKGLNPFSFKFKEVGMISGGVVVFWYTF